MSQLLSIHEAAEVEINEAADFYDLASPGLGSVFIDEVQNGPIKATTVTFIEAAVVNRYPATRVTVHLSSNF